MQPRSINITSSSLCYSPGILVWARNGYHHEADREMIVEALRAAYHLPRNMIEDMILEEDCLVEFVKENIQITLFKPEKYDWSEVGAHD